MEINLFIIWVTFFSHIWLTSCCLGAQFCRRSPERALAGPASSTGHPVPLSVCFPDTQIPVNLQGAQCSARTHTDNSTLSFLVVGFVFFYRAIWPDTEQNNCLIKSCAWSTLFLSGIVLISLRPTFVVLQARLDGRVGQDLWTSYGRHFYVCVCLCMTLTNFKFD